MCNCTFLAKKKSTRFFFLKRHPVEGIHKSEFNYDCLHCWFKSDYTGYINIIPFYVITMGCIHCYFRCFIIFNYVSAKSGVLKAGIISHAVFESVYQIVQGGRSEEHTSELQ